MPPLPLTASECSALPSGSHKEVVQSRRRVTAQECNLVVNVSFNPTARCYAPELSSPSTTLLLNLLPVDAGASRAHIENNPDFRVQ